MPVYPGQYRDRQIVLSHDWLTGMRGGERVLEILCQWFPGAPLYTLLHFPDAISRDINSHPVTTSYLQHIPGIRKHYRYFLPVFPNAIENLHPTEADLLISTNHCVAKGLPRPPGARHLCYCFTPMRYAWSFFDEYFGAHPLRRCAARLLLGSLRTWDRNTSAQVDRFVAISRHVQDRIRNCYGRESDIVYPPVDTDRLTPAPTPTSGSFDLIVSALVPYKKIDLAIRAYNTLGTPLKIVGVGTEAKTLRTLAGPHIEFLGWQDDKSVLELYRNCRLLVFPGEEDFGLVPLEAQACGKPVVAFAKGGALESIRENETGLFFHEQTESALTDAIRRCAEHKWDPAAARQNACRFGVQNFIDGLSESIRQCLA